ncbi:hypothetical protein TNCV_3317771 [Trichonephila clavipes]|nr:hypothetical protein TNCV_3317771 [Trichonephila clavipes]
MGILQKPGVLILSIQSDGMESCNPFRAVMYTLGSSESSIPSSTPRMCYALWWWTCGTHTGVINDLETMMSLKAVKKEYKGHYSLNLEEESAL